MSQIKDCLVDTYFALIRLLNLDNLTPTFEKPFVVNWSKCELRLNSIHNGRILHQLMPIVGFEGLELYILHRPHMDSIDLDPPPILGTGYDII